MDVTIKIEPSNAKFPEERSQQVHLSEIKHLKEEHPEIYTPINNSKSMHRKNKFGRAEESQQIFMEFFSLNGGRGTLGGLSLIE